MANYRYTSFKFNRANLAGVDADVVKSLNKFLCARETAINTITTSAHKYTDGPFKGMTIELTDHSAGMLPISVKGWIGCYVGGQWEGTTGAPLAMPAAADSGKATSGELPARGFDLLGDLLCELSEDPAERAETVTEIKTKILRHRQADDFGNELENQKQTGIYASFPGEARSVRINGKFCSVMGPAQIRGRESYSGNAWAVDDFGILFKVATGASSISQFEITYIQSRQVAQYTIGRATFKVPATSEAVDKLRTKILAKKKWFADKLLSVARPSQNIEAIAQAARQDVAQVVAHAQAAVAIEKASQTTTREAAEVAEVAELVECVASDCAPRAAANEYTDTRENSEHASDAGAPFGNLKPSQPGHAGSSHAAIKTRVDFCCKVILSGRATTRNFDNCFEQSEEERSKIGAEVFRRALKNPKMMAALPRYLRLDLLKENYRAHYPAQAALAPVTFAEFEACTLGALSGLLACSSSDAQGVAMPHQARMLAEFEAGTTPGAMASILDDLSKPTPADAPPAAPATPAPTPSEPTGQTIKGKSGNWSALFYTTGAGLPAMRFDQAGRDARSLEFATGRERMSALQQAASEADKPAQHADYTKPRETLEPNYTAPRETLTPEPFDLDSVDVMALTVSEAQALTLEQFTALYDQLEEINNHNVCLLLDALRAGCDDVAAQARGLIARHIQNNGMSEAMIKERSALQAKINAAKAANAPAAPDNTNTPKTSEPDSTAPRKTSGALSITITRGEGQADECGRPVTVGSFAEADAVLRAWSETAPASGGYDKCVFSITWPDGGSYEGRYDLKHHSAEKPSLSAHMIDHAEFMTGKYCPAHMSRESYDRYLSSLTDAQRAIYAEVLSIMAGLGDYFPKARPVALDLRALLAAGMQPGELVGFGVHYTGDMANAASNGAIISAELCEWQGVRVTAQFEDGSQNTISASQFSDKLGSRYRLNSKIHGAPYFAQLAAAVASKRARFSSAEEVAKQAHAKALQDLAAEFPQLTRADKTNSGGKLAAVNIRALLKAAFKGVKFSVTSDYSRVSIKWTDGPTDEQVNAIIGRFDIGASDSQSDYFYTVKTAFSELFGGVQYLFTERRLSDAAISDIIAQAWPDAADRPSLQDYKSNAGPFDWMRRDEWKTRQFYEVSKAWTAAGILAA